MLNKTEYRETGSVSVPSKTESDPTFVSSNGSDSKKSPVTSAVKNTDIPRVQPKNISVFGSTLVFRGELSADEEILIEGTVEGTIAHHKKHLIVGKEGRVTALIHASSITIEGRVDGDIHGDVRVRLTKGSEVNGNIFSPCIRMDEGARFNGTMHMQAKTSLSVAMQPTAV
jgi:cytoskeletal protein CcmA (bactofilin family)